MSLIRREKTPEPVVASEPAQACPLTSMPIHSRGGRLSGLSAPKARIRLPPPSTRPCFWKTPTPDSGWQRDRPRTNSRSWAWTSWRDPPPGRAIPLAIGAFYVASPGQVLFFPAHLAWLPAWRLGQGRRSRRSEPLIQPPGRNRMMPAGKNSADLWLAVSALRGASVGPRTAFYPCWLQASHLMPDSLCERALET